MTTLYLARHGETEDNVNRIMQGQTQGRLTGNGLRQAAALRDRLRDARIDAIVASDLRRAIDTAAVVATPRGMTVETTPLLRERDWGSFTGRFIPSLRDEPWPDDIESLDALKARAASFMEWLTGRWPGMAVLAGLECGSTTAGDRQGKSECYKLVQQLAGEFSREHGSITCSELLKLKKGAPLAYEASERTAEYYKTRPCVRQIISAARIYAEQLERIKG